MNFVQLHEVGSAAAAVSIPILKQQFDLENQYYIATTGQAMKPGSTYILSMNYQGFLNEDLKGFYRSSYTNKDGKTV